MDTTALSLILTALTTGAAAGVKDTASQAVTDAYRGLKERLQRKFANKPTALMVLTEHEQQPEVWKAPLEAVLKEAGVDQDQDIFAAAQQILSLVKPQQAMMIGKINVQTMGDIQNQIVGDHPTITINNSKE